VAASIAFACSSSSSGGLGATVTGSVGGMTFDLASDVAAILPSSSSSCSEADGGVHCQTNHAQTIGAILTNHANLTCGTLLSAISAKMPARYANLQFLEVGVENLDGVVTAGTYSIQSQGAKSTISAFAQFGATTTTCATGLTEHATSGSVTLTSATETEIAGSYSVTFATAGTLTGTFDIAGCAIPDGGLEVVFPPDGGMPPCMQ
jgi:hypothetical protein